MRFDKFTLKVQEGLQEAQNIAGQYGHQAIDAEHLLLVLLQQEEGIVGEILRKTGVDTARAEEGLRRSLDKMPKISGGGTGQVYLAPRLNRMLDRAIAEAARMKDEYVSAEHVLIAMAEDKEGVEVLRINGVTKDSIFKVLLDIRGNQRITDPNPEEKYQALKRYAKDFNELARKGAFDPVIGRDEEIRRIMQ
ncbi:MAG TPA: Clp protease N-terminal domain-containing protein, partial [Syntrophales bacterium]|nr:Clp protease N-terminal domain-containing protein [Syntrophales bacterium]